MWSTDRLRASVALVAALALAGACAHAPPTNGRAATATTPLDQYPVKVVEHPEVVALAVHPHGALSRAQEAALAAFAQTWRDAGASAAVVVRSPGDGGPDAQLSAQAAADRLVTLGVPPDALRLDVASDVSGPGAPVTARFERLATETPDCNGGWDNLTSTNGNGVSMHFGCAIARNFAAMLADPRDLQGPRLVTPADAGRRAMVLDNYRKGALTASAKDDQASGTVSQAVK